VFALKQTTYVKLPAHVCYMFRPVLRPSTVTSTQQSVQEGTIKIDGVSAYV